MTGPKITVSAEEDNDGRLLVDASGTTFSLRPGQRVSVFGYSVAVVSEVAGDACRVEVG